MGIDFWAGILLGSVLSVALTIAFWAMTTKVLATIGMPVSTGRIGIMPPQETQQGQLRRHARPVRRGGRRPEQAIKDGRTGATMRGIWRPLVDGSKDELGACGSSSPPMRRSGRPGLAAFARHFG